MLALGRRRVSRGGRRRHSEQTVVEHLHAYNIRKMRSNKSCKRITTVNTQDPSIA